jgi:hypothetical protein
MMKAGPAIQKLVSGSSEALDLVDPFAEVFSQIGTVLSLPVSGYTFYHAYKGKDVGGAISVEFGIAASLAFLAGSELWFIIALLGISFSLGRLLYNWLHKKKGAEALKRSDNAFVDLISGSAPSYMRPFSGGL